MGELYAISVSVMVIGLPSEALDTIFLVPVTGCLNLCSYHHVIVLTKTDLHIFIVTQHIQTRQHAKKMLFISAHHHLLAF